MRPWKILTLAALTVMASCADLPAPSNEVATKPATEADARGAANPQLPFGLHLTVVPPPTSGGLPSLHSYAHAEIANPSGPGFQVLLVGGRKRSDETNTGGLHTFKGAPDNNFPQANMNSALRFLNPATGEVAAFEVSQLSAELATALTVTNAQSYFDRTSGLLYICGGYGWKADGSDMLTSDALMALNVPVILAEIRKARPDPKVITAAIQITHDQAYKVTGGELSSLGGRFFLTFGQLFDGQYRAFGGDFVQQYIEAIRIFMLKKGTVERIGPVTSITYPSGSNVQDGQPFHRRDGNILDDVDPRTGTPRLIALGGVFLPGIIGAYVNPIEINADATYRVDTSFAQKFNQYEDSNLVVWSKQNQAVYRVLMGGIGHYYYFQTASQAAAYRQVTQDKRNDGFPFTADISIVMQNASGRTTEYLATSPMPDNRLLGASAAVLFDPQLQTLGIQLENGVLNLDQLQSGFDYPLGYIYGGIEAVNPLPLAPNTGTTASGVLVSVSLRKLGTSVLSADVGHEALPTANIRH